MCLFCWREGWPKTKTILYIALVHLDLKMGINGYQTYHLLYAQLVHLRFLFFKTPGCLFCQHLALLAVFLSHHDMPTERWFQEITYRYLKLTFDTRCFAQPTFRMFFLEFFEQPNSAFFLWGLPEGDGHFLCETPGCLQSPLAQLGIPARPGPAWNAKLARFFRLFWECLSRTHGILTCILYTLASFRF